MTRLGKVAVAAGILVVFVAGAASPSAASCAPPLPLSEALATTDLVVVGTVTATRSTDRVATVKVEDIWRGDADPVIEVAGGPSEPNSLTSVDRTYDVGTRYLFFIREPDRHEGSGTFGARYEDNRCADTRPYTAELDSLRPASARRTAAQPTAPPISSAATGAGDSDDGNAVVVFAIGGVLVCAALAVAAWRARLRNPSALE